MTNSVILVLVLVGLPASGKSTIARALVTLAARRPEEERNAGHCLSSLHYIEYDGVQESIMTGDESFIPDKECSKTGRSHQKHQLEDDASMLEAWRKSRLLALDRLGGILRQQQNRTEKKCCSNDDTESSSSSSFAVVLVDDNFHLRSMRKQVYQTCQQALTNTAALNDTDKVSDCMANDEGDGKRSSSHVQKGSVIYFGSVYINTPVEVCLERNRLRRDQPQNQTTHLTTSSPLSPSSSSFSSSRQSIVQQVGDETIMRMSLAMEPPAVGKASWEVDGAILTLNGCHPIDDLVQEVQRYIQVFYQLSSSSSQYLVDGAAADVLASLPPSVRAIVDPAVEVARLEEERRKTRDCLQHQLELSSRQWVAAVARIRPQQARVANQIRKEMLASFQQENEQKEKLQLQKGTAASSTTMTSRADDDGNNNTCDQVSSSKETLDILRHQFAEKLVRGHSAVQEANRTIRNSASSIPMMTWTDEEKELLWMELSS